MRCGWSTLTLIFNWFVDVVVKVRSGCGPGYRVGWAPGSTVPGGFLGRGTWWSAWAGWGQGQRDAQAGGQLVGPGPGSGDADGGFAVAADDARGGVQQVVAQGFGFGCGRGSVQAQQAQPAQ
jgi:hypothetical protein